MEADRNFINALAKGLNFIMTFSKDRRQLSLSELAKANDMNLPTARRYLHTLTNMGFVVKNEEDHTFQLTPKVLCLGAWVIDAMGIRERLVPYMTNITSQFDVTTHCAILEGDEIVTVERIRSSALVNLDLTPGTRLPVHSTGLGKAILAFMDPPQRDHFLSLDEMKPFTPHTIVDRGAFEKELEETRQRGYATADQELTMGIKSLAVPVMGPSGTVEASVAASYPVIRTGEPGLEGAVLAELMKLTNAAS